MDAYRLLRRTQVLAELPERTLRLVARKATRQYLRADNCVFKVGDPGDAFFVIESGQVEVLVGTGPESSQAVAQVLDAGGCFGEIALITDEPRTATVRTVSDSVLLRIERVDFLPLVSDVRFYKRMMEVVCSHLRRSNAALAEAERIETAMSRFLEVHSGGKVKVAEAFAGLSSVTGKVPAEASEGRPPLTVTVLHQLPGRLRLRLEPGSGSPRRLTTSVKGHPGIVELSYSPPTRSLLIRFDPHRVLSRALVLRAALAHSLAHGGSPVAIREASSPAPSASLVLASGLALGLAGVGRIAGASPAAVHRLDVVAGFSAVTAILQHGWHEARHRGSIDPEVLAVFYLLSSMAGGGGVRATAITWAATFVRHWLAPEDGGALLRPVMEEVDGQPRIHEVRLEPLPAIDRGSRMFDFLRTLVRSALAIQGGQDPRTLFGDIKALSRTHGSLLEGLEGARSEVTMRFD
ncbi:MAG: cyclic nucleotide-binding domain-containing protein [Candidatus Riflebacteria bacterium]|nr:cyclic nucleotide-binding domain-containing protein [Candidatus Riflebacteria bacterium]